jgi:hypothetical protein
MSSRLEGCRAQLAWIAAVACTRGCADAVQAAAAGGGGSVQWARDAGAAREGRGDGDLRLEKACAVHASRNAELPCFAFVVSALRRIEAKHRSAA